MQDKQSAALHWAPACAGATDIWRPLQNALPVAPAQAGAQPEAQLQLSGR